MAHTVANAPATGESRSERHTDTAQGATRAQPIRIDQHSASGLLWLAGWLFTIGYLHLPFWKGVLAVVLWPYYMGASF